MIRRIWIKNFRMLANNRVDVAPFDVLVGRNASGKSTRMSALRFISAYEADAEQITSEQVCEKPRGSRRNTSIRRGMEVAELEGWRSRVSVADLFATGAMVGDGGANSTKNKSRLVRAGSDLDTRRSRGGLAMTMSPGGRAVKAGRARTAKDPT